jgi:hypothetical protein
LGTDRLKYLGHKVSRVLKAEGAFFDYKELILKPWLVSKKIENKPNIIYSKF